jgi:hypothetical protein
MKQQGTATTTSGSSGDSTRPPPPPPPLDGDLGLFSPNSQRSGMQNSISAEVGTTNPLNGASIELERVEFLESFHGGGEEWSCLTCTLINIPQADACAACMMPRNEL